jgi:hypothetical protein
MREREKNEKKKERTTTLLIEKGLTSVLQKSEGEERMSFYFLSYPFFSVGLRRIN